LPLNGGDSIVGWGQNGGNRQLVRRRRLFTEIQTSIRPQYQAVAATAITVGAISVPAKMRERSCSGDQFVVVHFHGVAMLVQLHLPQQKVPCCSRCIAVPVVGPPSDKSNQQQNPTCGVDRIMECNRLGGLFHEGIVKIYAEEKESFAEVVHSSTSPGGLLFSISNRTHVIFVDTRLTVIIATE